MDLAPPAAASRGHTIYGMFFGAMAFYRASEYTRERIHTMGIRHAAGVAAAIAMTAGRLLGGRGADWRQGEGVELSIDGAPAEVRPGFLLLATTLRRFVLGLHPFWADAAGPLRYLDIAAPPQRLSRALLPVMLGRPRPWMQGLGYRSGRADRLTVALRSPFLLDGEVFAPTSVQGITLSAGPAAEFVRL